VTGLLRRLAHQIVGTPAPRLHAMARLPYMARAQLPDAEVPTAAASAAYLEPRPTFSEATSDVPQVGATSPSSDRPIPAAPQRAPSIQASPKADPLPAATDFAANTSTTPMLPHAPLVPAAGHGLVRGHATRLRTSSGAAAAAMTADVPPVVDGAVALVLPPMLVAPAGNALQGTGARPLSRRSDAAGRPSPTRQEHEWARAPSVSGDTSEVHVHIGRIEVTAIQEPAPRPRAAREGPKPMSLDEYLTKRRGREG